MADIYEAIFPLSKDIQDGTNQQGVLVSINKYANQDDTAFHEKCAPKCNHELILVKFKNNPMFYYYLTGVKRMIVVDDETLRLLSSILDKSKTEWPKLISALFTQTGVDRHQEKPFTSTLWKRAQQLLQPPRQQQVPQPY